MFINRKFILGVLMLSGVADAVYEEGVNGERNDELMSIQPQQIAEPEIIWLDPQDDLRPKSKAVKSSKDIA
jgi:hypothetical protein